MSRHSWPIFAVGSESAVVEMDVERGGDGWDKVFTAPGSLWYDLRPVEWRGATKRGGSLQTRNETVRM